MMAPVWIEKNIAMSARIAIAMPIQNALAPISSAQSGTSSVIMGIWLRLKKPVANTAARPNGVATGESGAAGGVAMSRVL